MIRRSPPFREISDAWEALHYALSPPDRSRGWYVVIAQSPPWCQSVWRSLTYDLSRPGSSPQRPAVFFTKSVSHNIDSYVPLVLRAEPHQLQVEHDGGILDLILNRRRHVETYSIDGRVVRRVQPVAFNVRDFVDEWLSVPWDVAKDWSVRSLELENAHSAIRSSVNAAEAPPQFGTVRRCTRGGHECDWIYPLTM